MSISASLTVHSLHRGWALLKEAKGSVWLFFLTLSINFCGNFNFQCYISTSRGFPSTSQDLNISLLRNFSELCLLPFPVLFAEFFFFSFFFVSVVLFRASFSQSPNVAESVAMLSQCHYFTLIFHLSSFKNEYFQEMSTFVHLCVQALIYISEQTKPKTSNQLQYSLPMPFSLRQTKLHIFTEDYSDKVHKKTVSMPSLKKMTYFYTERVT